MIGAVMLIVSITLKHEPEILVQRGGEENGVKAFLVSLRPRASIYLHHLPLMIGEERSGKGDKGRRRDLAMSDKAYHVSNKGK